jgi:hypothetical protein
MSNSAASGSAAAAPPVLTPERIARLEQMYQALLQRQWAPVAPLTGSQQSACVKAFSLLFAKDHILSPDHRLILQNWLLKYHVPFRHWMTYQLMAGKIRQSLYDLLTAFIVRLRQHAREEALLRMMGQAPGAGGPGAGTAGGGRKKTRKQNGGFGRTNISYLAPDLYTEFYNPKLLLKKPAIIPLNYNKLYRLLDEMILTNRSDFKGFSGNMEEDLNKIPI